MKTPTRRDQAAEEARRRILVAAADCLVRDGLAQVRMAAIAKQAGVSSGLVHYHFATKEQLFAEVLTYSSALSRELTQRVLERAGAHPAQRLWTFLDRCLPSDELLARDWLLWQELDLLCMRNAEMAAVSDGLYDQFYETAASIITDGVRAGQFAVAVSDIRRVAESAVALCDGLGTRVLSASKELELEDARVMVAAAVGQLVGHAGPLPRSSRTLQASR